MLLSQFGEWKLIEQLARRFSHLGPEIGIGDDAAVIPLNENSSLLVTTDMLIEETHFLKQAISPKDLGHKSLAVNLSDIAAMGGKPTSAFLSLGLPAETPLSWIDSFFDGFQKLADRFQTPLLGGDTTESKNGIFINVTVLGLIENQFLKLRSQARWGDWICVTGFLGDSAAGLQLILNNEAKENPSLVFRHHHPEPHLREGQWLAQQSAVHAMMDISDGLHLSLQQLGRSSQCGAEIELSQLPVSFELQKTSLKMGWDPLRWAASGGEDYCLLVTVDPTSFEKIKSEFELKFSKPLYGIGKVTQKDLSYLRNGRSELEPLSSWNHFGNLSKSTSKPS